MEAIPRLAGRQNNTFVLEQPKGEATQDSLDADIMIPTSEAVDRLAAYGSHLIILFRESTGCRYLLIATSRVLAGKGTRARSDKQTFGASMNLPLSP